MNSSLELLRMIYSPNRRLIGLLIVVSKEPKVIHELTGFLVKHNMVPLYANFSSLNGDIEVTVFLDITKVKEPLKEIVKNISKVKNVKNVHLIKPLFKGLIIDTIHFPILLLGRRSWIMDEASLKGLLRDVKVEFGEAGRVFLYHLGVRVGKSIFENYRAYAGTDEEFYMLVKALAKAIGWGDMKEFKMRTDGTYIAKIFNNTECIMSKPSKRPTGDFSRGILAGIVSKLTGKLVRVEETMCIAKEDPYCEFIILPTK